MSLHIDYPENGVLNLRKQGGDFFDPRTVRVASSVLPVSEIARRHFFGMPRWIVMLLFLRNIVMWPFGLARGGFGNVRRLREDYQSDLPRTGPFALQMQTGDEIILGSDDWHLDFRISIMRFDRNGPVIAFTTWARPHNWFGRCYLVAVYPFHVLIVNTILKKIAGAKV